MTAADPQALEDMAKVLLRRADDLHSVGTTLCAKANAATWQCDKADRFREAMRVRQAESLRLAVQLRDLGRYLRAQSQTAQQAPAATPVPGSS